MKEDKKREVRVEFKYGDRLSLSNLFQGRPLKADVFWAEIGKWMQRIRQDSRAAGCHRFEVSFEEDVDCGAELTLTGFRMETDAEFEARKVKSGKQKAAARIREDQKRKDKEAQERRLLADLKKKYE